MNHVQYTKTAINCTILSGVRTEDNTDWRSSLLVTQASHLKKRSRMVGVVAKVALLVYISQMIVEVAGQSPCPNYFRYVQEESSEEIMGYIEIPWPPKGVPLHLSVTMSIAVPLPTQYVGRVELAQPKEASVKAVQQGRPLGYKIHFPLRRPIPYLTGLLFNNQEICSGPRATGPIVTSIVLNHTLYPPGVLPLFDKGSVLSNEPDFYVTSQPVPTKLPVFQTATPTMPVLQSGLQTNKSNENDEKCGISSKVIVISKGEAIRPGQWPWLVAIYIDKHRLEFRCAGTLLTHTHVLTAAHCFISEEIKLPPVWTIVVSVGRYRLREFGESGSVNMEVASYTIHPDYSRGLNADSDLAIVVMRENVEYSARIKPICLWTGSTDLKSVVGETGYVVGWGRDELGKQYVEEPRMTNEPIVSQEVCLWSDEIFVVATSNRTFCAGSKNGSGFCNGDSGSGFVMYNQTTHRYYIRGVVSRWPKERDSRACDVKKYVVYVDVPKYLDWIREQIST